MAINFPSVTGLSDGYQEIIDGKLYTLNKTSNTVFYWSASLAENPDDRYVNITGDNMTGPLGGVTTLTSTGTVTGSDITLQAGPTWSTGTGTPEGSVTAPVGSIFSRTDGSAGTTLYVKESGTGNTGWNVKTSSPFITTEALSGTGNSIAIPPGTKEIEILFDQISSNGGNNTLIQLGSTVDGLITTGYDSYSVNPAGNSSTSSTSGFTMERTSSADSMFGKMTLYKMDTKNVWYAEHKLGFNGANGQRNGNGYFSGYSGEINEVFIGFTGTNVWDAGEVSVRVTI